MTLARLTADSFIHPRVAAGRTAINISANSRRSSHIITAKHPPVGNDPGPRRGWSILWVQNPFPRTMIAGSHSFAGPRDPNAGFARRRRNSRPQSQELWKALALFRWLSPLSSHLAAQPNLAKNFPPRGPNLPRSLDALTSDQISFVSKFNPALRRFLRYASTTFPNIGN